MLTVEEAAEIVRRETRRLDPRRVPLSEALGCRLAEAVAADIDLPPFDKALMDGYAVRSSDCMTEGAIRLRIGEEITAGRTASRPLAEGEAAVIMTGAPLPPGADSVVPHEKTALDGDFVVIPGPIQSGECRLPRGREMTRGQVLFAESTWLDPMRIGVLASVGQAEPLVVPRPRVAILPTGDELTPVATVPGPGQIRESNATMLAAMVQASGGIPIVHPVAPDDADALAAALNEALAPNPDVLLLCGGVSAGKRDLVPTALERVEIQILFHKIRLRPGKPLLFGSRKTSVERFHDTAPRHKTTLVFGLPGNPVSGAVNFLLFVRPLLLGMRGRGEYQGPIASWFRKGQLAAPYRHRGDRPTCHPVRVEPLTSFREGPLSVIPLDWAGSADLLTVANAHGFLYAPAGDRDYADGETVHFFWNTFETPRVF